MEFITSFVEFLNKNSGAITIITTIVLVCITAWYTKLTRILVKNSNIPHIVIYLYTDRDRGTLYLCIENVGNGFAHDIKFSTDAKLIPYDIRNPYNLSLGEMEPLKSGISYLNSGNIDMIHICLWPYLAYRSKEEIEHHKKEIKRISNQVNAEEPFHIKVDYKDLSNSKKSQTFYFHIGNKEYNSQFSKPRSADANIAEELQKINGILSALNQHFFKAHITTPPPNGYHVSNLERIAESLEKITKGI